MHISKKMLLLLLFTAGFTLQMQAQKKLLSIDRTQKNDTTPTRGANERNFTHTFLGLGMILGEPGTGLEIGYGRSLQFQSGYRYKFKLSNMFSVGLEPTYKYAGINISQRGRNDFLDNMFFPNNDTSGNIGPDVIHKREKLGFHTASLGGFLRINFDPKRGNYMGYYLDLGASGDYIFAQEHISVDELTDGTMKKKRFTRFPQVSKWQYNYNAKLGFNWFALTFSYRPSPIWKRTYNFPELPRYVAGVEFNFYSK